MPQIDCPKPNCNHVIPDVDGAVQVILLNEHFADDHPRAAPGQVQPSRFKLEQPTIAAGCDPDEWSAFERGWRLWKDATRLEANQVSTVLFHCCDKDLRTDIMRGNQGDIARMAEADLLLAIKRLAVTDESVLVQRIKMGKLIQAPGVGIKTFHASLKGQAALCDYRVACKEDGCDHMVDYSEEVIKDSLIRGIADQEILADLLGDTTVDGRSLEDTIKFIARKEQGKMEKSTVGDSINAACSGIKTQSQKKCWACGDNAHEVKNDKRARSQKCKAWEETCAKCDKKGHFTKCCSKCNFCGLWGHRDKSFRTCPQNTKNQEDSKNDAGFIVDQTSSLCTVIESRSRGKVIAIEHHIFDKERGWVARPSMPHPTILTRAKIEEEDHSVFGTPIADTSKLRVINMPMIADSGCQSTIIPLQSAYALGIRKKDLIPARMKMRAADGKDLGVMGAVVIKFSSKDGLGIEHSTKQLCYVSDMVTGAFLCREAMLALNVLPETFPKPQPAESEVMSSEDAPACHCPRRPKLDDHPAVPDKLPEGMRPSMEDVDKLKQWLLDHWSSTTFNICDHQELPKMTGPPLHLHVDPDAVPVAVHKPAMVPIHWQEKVKADLERDVRIGVLERVPENTPVTWSSRMVVTAKSDGSPRRTVDLQPQNRHSVRQTHHVPSPFHLADQVPKETKKTVTDCKNGYHSVPIREEDRHITTFITPWGRFRYRVSPQGFLSSGDGYTQRFDAIIAEFPDKVKCVDDTCMWTNSVEESFKQSCQWLDLLGRNGITLNPKKFQFCEDIVEFAGMEITETSVRPGKKFLNSIRNYPTPKDISGARGWFGLVNQGAYAYSMTREMQPFRHLLKPKSPFVWTEELDKLFQKSKGQLIEGMKEGVRLFDCSLPTCLAHDWSADGIGFFMLQKHCKCPSRTPVCCPDGWKLCLVGSRFTHAAESRYASIEGEALSLVYALQQTRYFVLGCQDLIIATDHKPLLRIMNDRSLAEIDNRRLLNLKEKTLGYRFKMVFVPGKLNVGPDALSRYPGNKSERLQLEGEAPETDMNPYGNMTPAELRHEILGSISQFEDDEDIAGDELTIVSAVCALASMNVVTWEMVREATTSDENFRQLVNLLEEGIPQDCRQMPAELRPFHRLAASLFVIDGVVMMGNRGVIPPILRERILQALHAAHQGVNHMRERAMDSVYWPNITIDIARARDQCVPCNKMAKSNQSQPPMEPAKPDFPFQQIVADYFSLNGKSYLVIVDRYSHWPVVHKAEGGAKGLVDRLRDVFTTYGIPEELTSDGGPQFSAGITKEFLTSWGVRHRMSSVAFPHANCRAELGVKSAKRMLTSNCSPSGSLDVDKFQQAMLAYRNAIDPQTKASPAMILFGRQIRDAIPVMMGRFSPHETWRELMEHREKAMAQRHSRGHEAWSQGTRRLPPLKTGDQVYVQNQTGNHPRRWERTGTVVEVRQFDQYVVKMDGSGRATLRNRVFLRKYKPFYPKSPIAQAPELPPASLPSIQREEIVATRPPVMIPPISYPPREIPAPVLAPAAVPAL